MTDGVGDDDSTHATNPASVVARFDKNVKAVLSLSDLDRGLLDSAIEAIQTRDERLLNSGVDNPRMLAGNTLATLRRVRENDSLRPGFQALVNQSVVLLVSYLSSAVSDLFKVGVARTLAGTPSDYLRDLPLKLSVGQVASLGGDLQDTLPDLVAETPGISFQDTKSIARTFSQFFAVDIAVDSVTNDVTAGLAFRHVLVHSGGVVDRRCARQLEKAVPRSLRARIRVGQTLEFTTEEVGSLAEAMTSYVGRLALLLEEA